MREHFLDYEEINLLTDNINREELLKILSLTEEGFEEIISKRSRAYKRLKIDFENISVNELLDLIEKNRTLLRRPLILDERRLQVGYNEDDIRKFLPRNVRSVEMKLATENVRSYDLEREKNENQLEIGS